MVHLRLEELENFAKENNVPIMQKDGISFLVNYIKENNIKSILEIGTAIGYSSIKMALASPNVCITTLERNKEMYDIAVKNIKEFNLEDRINAINIDALSYTSFDKYDLIFIDAAKSQYIKFFERFEKSLDKGGVIVSDNLSFHGLVEDVSKTNNRNTRQLVGKIKKYIEYLKLRDDFKTNFYDLGDGISISKKD